MTIRTLFPLLFVAVAAAVLGPERSVLLREAGRGLRSQAQVRRCRNGAGGCRGCRDASGRRGRVGGILSPIRIASLALSAVLPAACGDRPDASDGTPQAEWITEPEYRIGDAAEGDALFGRVPYLRVGPYGRVFVVEAMVGRVSVWTPAGERLFSLGGPGEGPGDFMLPYKIHFEDSRFYVRDWSRFTWFRYDGTILETVPNPPTSVGWRGFGLRMDALLADGSLLGLSQLPFSVRLGLLGDDDPVDRTPLFSVRNTERGWVREPVYWIDGRRSLYAIPTLEGNGYYFQGQPYWESDQYEFDPGTGTVVVARVAGEGLGPGEADLIEVTARGDTAWRRRLRFEPVRVTPEMAEAEIDALVERAGGFPREDMNRWLRHAREVIENTVRVPRYAPAVKTLTMASSGQLWLRSHEKSDTLSVWYSLDRGAESPPRRVLLPDWLFVRDATDTHVWGVWRDELDINYVVGRRLVPASARRR